MFKKLNICLKNVTEQSIKRPKLDIFNLVTLKVFENCKISEYKYLVRSIAPTCRKEKNETNQSGKEKMEKVCDDQQIHLDRFIIFFSYYITIFIIIIIIIIITIIVIIVYFSGWYFSICITITLIMEIC